MSQASLRIAKANYGLDAPGLVRKFLFFGGGGFVVGVGLLIWGVDQISTVVGAILTAVGSIGALTGLSFVVTALAMIWSSFSGKMHARDHLLDGLDLKGDEIVLDVGCGRGLLLIGAAQRLPHGRVVGLDLWSQEDQSNNSKSATLANAQAEGVADRVEVQEGDMRKMSFADGTFDAIVANLSIHNIYKREGRREAIDEIVRVLKPKGKVALMDFEHVKEYGEDLQAAGMQAVKVSGRSFWIYPPVRTVTGMKQ